MVKLRDARYCNLKLFLIFLVIYGHLIEPEIYQSEVLMVQYRLIYLVHMPLFSFLSGLFLNNAKVCKSQLFRMFPLYIVLQAIAVLAGHGETKLLTPFWHLWYLLSYCMWLCIAWAWFRFFKGKGKIIILPGSIVVGCLAGLVPFIGRAFSLSRTLVFLPYFWSGLICNPDFSKKKLRFAGGVAVVVAAVLMLCVGKYIPVTFLYQAAPYDNLKNGVLLRLACYLLGGALGLCLLMVTPAKRLSFTKLGANTMPAYLLHAPVVLYIRDWDIPWPLDIIIAMAFLYFTDRLLRWHSKLYGIVPVEGRNNRWQLFRKSTKNMHNRSIGSYCP